MNLKRSLENLFKLNSVMLTTRSSSDPTQAVPVTSDDPLPVVLAGGGGGAGGGPTDPASSREATQQEVLAAVQALAPLLGSTDGLETLAATNRDLLTNLGQYTDGLENLLTLLSTNTDGIESLLSALGVNDQNVIGKLEALRLLLSGTLSVNVQNFPAQSGGGGDVRVTNFPATQPVSATSLPLPAGAATENTLAQVNSRLGNGLRVTTVEQLTVSLWLSISIKAGASVSDPTYFGDKTVLRVAVDAGWTPADVAFQVSNNNLDWFDVCDAQGNLLTVKVSPGRAVTVPHGALRNLGGQIRVRSGTPDAPVAQAQAMWVRLHCASF